MGFKEFNIREDVLTKKNQELKDGYSPVVERVLGKNKVRHDWIDRYNPKSYYWQKTGEELIELLISERAHKKKRVNFPKLRKFLKKNGQKDCYPDLVELTAVVYEAVVKREEEVRIEEDFGPGIILKKEQIWEVSIRLLADALANQHEQMDKTLEYLGLSDGGSWLGVDLEEAGFKEFCQKDVWSSLKSLRKRKKAEREGAGQGAADIFTKLEPGQESENLLLREAGTEITVY